MDVQSNERLVEAQYLEVGMRYQQGERDGVPTIVTIVSVNTVGVRTVLGLRDESQIDANGCGGHGVFVYHYRTQIPVQAG